MSVVRIGIGQINTRVGDFEGNVEKIIKVISEAGDSGVDLLVFPEMAVTGYPPSDLLFRGSFIKASSDAMNAVAKKVRRKNLVVIAGGIEVTDSIYNAAAVIHRGKIRGWARKRYLFCCGSFDETRYFSSGERAFVIDSGRFRTVVTLGDDLGYPVFPGDVQLLVNLWNDPFHYGHRPVKERMMTDRSREEAVGIVIASPVGGEDSMIFEGSSMVLDGFGDLAARGTAFKEDLVLADLDIREIKTHRERIFHVSGPRSSKLDKARVLELDWKPPENKKEIDANGSIASLKKGPDELYTALVTATRDFVNKNGFEKVFIGISGGIDSALIASIACDALGQKNVTAVSMPAPYTSKETRDDAKRVSTNLGIKFMEIPISNTFRSIMNTLAPTFEGYESDTTEENLQPRIRSQILMALANKFGAMVLATSNKSEAATGYFTMYGDGTGAFAPLIDVYKTQVYEISAWLNESRGREVIPESTIHRPPTAELKPGQVDQDVLPPYKDLDRILKNFLEEGWSVSELINKGEDRALVEKIMCMLMDTEFKRRQAPFGPTVSERPLSDLRIPITKRTGWWFEGKGSCAHPGLGGTQKASKRKKTGKNKK